MCGFIFYLSKKNIEISEKKNLKNVAKLIRHRGPDFQKTLSKKNIFAYHCRLSIQDLNKRSNQPFFSKDNRFMLLFNGEIYNFKDLKKKLKKKYNFITSSDTEVVMATYLVFGEKFLSKISGMYSILIYDFKLKKVILARDPFGQKPLYYFSDKQSLLISSEIKPIQKFKRLKINKNEASNYFLNNNFANKRKTIIDKVLQIEAGELVKINKNIKIKTQKYFSKSDLDLRKIKSKNFSSCLKKTIKNHVITDTKLGVAISSGLDSRSICAILSLLKQSKKLAKAYFINFKNYNIERDEVIKFCKFFKIKLEIINVEPTHIINKFESSIKYNESPLGGIMNIALFMLCEKAKKDKIKVILGGYGLDEALGGYDILNPNIFVNKSISLNPILIDGSRLDNRYLIKKKFTFKKNRKIIMNDKYIHNKQIDLLLNDKIPRTLHMVDRFSMAHSIEFRNPYIDFEFIKNCLKIPKKNYFFNKIGKLPMRKILKNNFNKYENWFEQKKSVQSPQSEWLREKKIKKWVTKIINNKTIYKENSFLIKKNVKKYWKKYINREIHFSLPIWQILNLYYLSKIFKIR